MSHSDKHERHAGSQSRTTGASSEGMQSSVDERAPGASADASYAATQAAERQDSRQGGEPGGVAGAGGLMADTMQTVGAVGGGAVGATHGVLKGAISATEDVGTNLVGGTTHVAKGLVYGVRDIGSDVGLAVRDGATGLLHVVGDVGGTTVHTVRDLLVDIVSGLRDVAGAAMGRGPGAGARSALTGSSTDAQPRRDIAREREYAAQQAGERAPAPTQSTSAQVPGDEYLDMDQGADGQPLPSLNPFPTGRHH